MRLPRFHVYLLFSQKTGQVYLGYTSDLRRRFRQHNARDNTGWTRRGKPWRLLSVQSYFDKHSALIAEQRLKESRSAKKAWINALPRLARLQSLSK